MPDMVGDKKTTGGCAHSLCGRCRGMLRKTWLRRQSRGERDGDQLALYEQLTLFGDVLERVRAEYVDASDEELMKRH